MELTEIIAENVPSLRKEFRIQVRKPSGTPNTYDDKRSLPRYTLIKLPDAKNKTKTQNPQNFKRTQRKTKDKYKGKPFRFTQVSQHKP